MSLDGFFDHLLEHIFGRPPTPRPELQPGPRPLHTTFACWAHPHQLPECISSMSLDGLAVLAKEADEGPGNITDDHLVLAVEHAKIFPRGWNTVLYITKASHQFEDDLLQGSIGMSDRPGTCA
eukprot:gnl/TRDRNA2_/TRDRNA2_69400_c1_seq1.p3 gnl/TRDRNA2_/TRDRNA2_69400_c1~~gnl/TRDRNA2_/TRDRNA2_69400_c1_seq1.p3  ORF type:complete len:123 (-),score=12.91 gnl/TRDRNA2_/TRDRNA2_69400_c1_seq1:621-989(-)